METQKKRSAVEQDEIIAHLRVLAAFHKLKLDVQARAPHDPTGLWTVFLGIAVEKFASWVSNVLGREGSDDPELREGEYPTLDVAMVWHAYILNPLEYHKDCQKSQNGLLRIKAFPIKRLADLIDTLGLESRFPVPAFGSKEARVKPRFSIDLVAAVKRQASFIAQVAAVGWTQNPNDLRAIVTGAIDKYHCFLKKLWENPEALAIPNLEIDLAWHTHQLNVETYRRDSMMLFGRILQHDDDIPSPELNKAFRGSSYDWKNLFHMDYSSGAICTGFRPMSAQVPRAPGGKRPPSRDCMNGSEISLHESYLSATEKRLSGGMEPSSRPSSMSLSPPESSGSDEASSSLHSVTTQLSGLRTPSTNGDLPAHPRGLERLLKPTNDSTVTLSPRNNAVIPSTLGSRMSSTSDVSSLFANAPPKPKNLNEGRGASDRPPVSSHRLAPPLIGKRPSSAGSSVPSRPSIKQGRHQISNSTGTLYVPEMPSPLRHQRPEISAKSLEEKSESSHTTNKEPSYLTRSSSTATRTEITPFSSQASLVMATPLSSRTLTSTRQENSHAYPSSATKSRRPASAGNAAPTPSNYFLSNTPPIHLSKHPSSIESMMSKKSTDLQAPEPASHSRRPSSSASTASRKSTSSSLWFFSRSRPVSPERVEAPVETPPALMMKSLSTSSLNTAVPGRRPSSARPSTAPRMPTSHYTKRPSTAPHQPPSMLPEVQKRSASSGIFKKKNKTGKDLSSKKSWFKLW